MFNIDLAIKFGSNEIIIYRKGVGIIAKEPAYLAVVEINGKTKVKAIGKRAEKMFYSKTDQVNVYQPIVNSEIVNEKMAVVLISEILSNIIQDKFMLSNLSALVAVPCALGHDQLLLIKRVLHESGVNKVEFVQNSVCVQTSLDLDPQSHIMVVDIGKYITDISVLNEFNFSFGRMYYIGGQDMDKSIATFVLDNHNLHVSELTCENIKNE
ncbi:MAG: rod shape-determining protein, partial [Clostridia bacterium]|nr:rod shape-determining protein [Clostridia bacterium]